MKILATAMLAVGLLGCTTLADLKKPEQQSYFVLDQDHVRTQIRGLANFKWVEGLRPGKYVAVGEDRDGIYYQGEGECVILASNEEADYYLANGHVSSGAETRNIFPRVLNVGGLWLSKPGVRQPPKLFYVIRNTTDGSKQGLVGISIVSMTEGSLGYVNYDSERDFLNGLTFVRD